MANTSTQLVQQRITLILTVVGLIFIIAANAFHIELLKVKIDHVLAEIGALFLIVGTLHWMFENSLRKEMLKDIASTALGSSRIHDIGLVDCVIDSGEVSESNLWIASNELIIGIHYSPKYLNRIYTVLKQRCEKRKLTKICVVNPKSEASQYLEKSQNKCPDIQKEINEIKKLIELWNPDAQYINLYYHERILRYNFIYTEQFIWINFLQNSRITTVVPAFKMQAGTPLFSFFENDIKFLLNKDCKPELLDIIGNK